MELQLGPKPHRAHGIHFEPVRHLLSQKPAVLWSVAPGDTVFDAIALMDSKQIGALVVLDESALCGIITERDYARKVILKGRSSKDTAVREIMTTPVLTVGPEATVDECLRMMTDKRVRHLPVMDGGSLLGIISIGDLVRSVIATQAETIEQMAGYISGRYPA